MQVKTLISEQNAKTTKGEEYGYLTGILYMAPHSIVKGINVCPFATEECKAACLYSAGRGKFSNVQKARIRKTELFKDDKQTFFSILVKDIERLKRKANKKGLKLAIRLNGTSDISWENFKITDEKLTIFDLFPDVQFYDYTKNHTRFRRKLPSNYHLTLSHDGYNLDKWKNLENQPNYAVVFANELPIFWQNKRVINGDAHDLRFTDSQDIIVGLIAKGDAKKLNNAFIVKQ
jgi:hypothetical protein